MSGSTRSTPRCSSRGKASPASTTMRSPPCSYTVMFFPTSPRPPSGMMRKLTRGSVCAPLDRGGSEQAEPGEAVAHGLALLLGRVDERQPMTADVVAQQVQRRLDRDRVRGDPQELDRRAKLAIERPRRVVLTLAPEPDQLFHLGPDDVRVDADAAPPAELEERQDQVVVARVEVEPGRDDVPRLGQVVVRLLDTADILDLGEPRDRLGLD